MRLGRPKDNLDYANPRGRPSIIAVWQHNLLVSKNAEIIIFSSPLCFSSPQDRRACSAVRESFATRAQPSAKRSCPRKSPSRGSSQGGSDRNSPVLILLPDRRQAAISAKRGQGFFPAGRPTDGRKRSPVISLLFHSHSLGLPCPVRRHRPLDSPFSLHPFIRPSCS